MNYSVATPALASQGNLTAGCIFHALEPVSLISSPIAMHHICHGLLLLVISGEVSVARLGCYSQ